MSEADVLHRRAVAAFERGDVAEAIRLLSAAIGLADGRADFHADLAVIAHRAGDAALAERHFARAAELDPSDARIVYNHANFLKDAERFEDALEGYARAIDLDPSFAPAHNNRGNVLRDLKRWGEARAAYEAAVAADADYAPALLNLADLDETQGRTETAIVRYSRVAALRDDPGARVRAALALPVIVNSVAEIEAHRLRFANGIAALRAAGLRLDDPIKQVGSTPFHLAYHGRDDRVLMEDLASFYREACPSLGYVAPHCEGWLGGLEGGPIRVGFVSAFLHDHTIARLNRGLIANLPRDRFDVRVFDNLPRDLAAARATIAEAELDILYYTDIGMEPLTYFLAFSRLAPIQCVSWGHPVTTGVPSIDYFVSSDAIEPEGAEAVYSERLVRLGSLPASVPAAESAMPAEAGPAFLCPQSLFKLHPDFDPLIGDILARCPGEELWVLAGQHRDWQEALSARWRRTIPHVVDRIRFVPRRARADFVALLASARVVLDTPHFCGGLTSFEALTAGAPVVALPGAYMRSRVTLGLYRRMGFADLVAKSAEDYVENAVRLACDGDFYTRVRARIRDAAPRLIDDAEPVAEHARLFEKAVYGAL